MTRMIHMCTTTPPTHRFAGSGLTASTLLAFYEAVHLNPAFAIGMISGFSAASAPVYPPPPAPPPSSSATATTSSSSPGSPILGPVPLASSRAPAAAASAVGPTHANVFAKFLEFCGLVFTELPDQHTLTFAKLSLLVLLTVTEANNLNKLLHDPANSITLVPSVLPRVRCCVDSHSHSHSLTHAGSCLVNKQPNPKEKFAPITVVLDLVIHFIKNNLKKPLQVDLYMYVLRRPNETQVSPTTNAHGTAMCRCGAGVGASCSTGKRLASYGAFCATKRSSVCGSTTRGTACGTRCSSCSSSSERLR